MRLCAAKRVIRLDEQEDRIGIRSQHSRSSYPPRGDSFAVMGLRYGSVSATEAAMMLVPAKWYNSPRFTLAQKPASAARSAAKSPVRVSADDITGLDAEFLQQFFASPTDGSLIVEVMVRVDPRIDVRIHDDAWAVGV